MTTMTLLPHAGSDAAAAGELLAQTRAGTGPTSPSLRASQPSRERGFVVTKYSIELLLSHFGAGEVCLAEVDAGEVRP